MMNEDRRDNDRRGADQEGMAWTGEERRKGQP